MKVKQLRATFEDVGNAQDILLDFIDKCIESNRVLTDDERRDFVKNLRSATLGLGTEYSFIINGDKGAYDLKHVEHAAYWLAYQKSSPIVMGKESIEICRFWRKLRDMLFLIFPYAIATSIRISKEQTHIAPAEAKEV